MMRLYEIYEEMSVCLFFENEKVYEFGDENKDGENNINKMEMIKHYTNKEGLEE